MKYLLSFLIFVLSVSVTKAVTDRICYDETREEICESFGLQCGVTIMLSECGKEKSIECVCQPPESCSLKDFKCQ